MYQPSAKAAQIIEAIEGFVRDQVRPLEQQAQLDWARPHPQPVLRQVWKLASEQGLYTVMLPESMGGAGLNVADLCAVKEATVLTLSLIHI